MITGFEGEVARLLGKEAAVFMPSGTMCQQIALRIWTDRRGCPNCNWTSVLSIQRWILASPGTASRHTGSWSRRPAAYG